MMDSIQSERIPKNSVRFYYMCLFTIFVSGVISSNVSVSTGEQGAGVGEPANRSSLV